MPGWGKMEPVTVPREERRPGAVAGTQGRVGESVWPAEETTGDLAGWDPPCPAVATAE